VILLLVGFLAGLVTGISPCILPVLPVIFASGAASGLQDDSLTVVSAPVGAMAVARTAGTGVGAGAGPASPVTDPGDPSDSGTVGSDGSGARAGLDHIRRRRRPLAVVAGLVLSFSLATLAGSWLLGALGLPLDLLRWVGIAVLALLGAGLLVPAVGAILERPFVRLTGGHQVTEGGGFVLGLSLGLVFVPCAGPVLATLTVVGAERRVGWSAVVLTLAFATGVAIPLLAFALVGRYLAARMPEVRGHAAIARRVIGVVLLLTALVLSLNLTDGLQRAVPGYTDALTNHLEANGSARQALAGVTGSPSNAALANCTDASPVLQQCGMAPSFTGISRWLGTPGDRPLTLAGMKGRVVLVDFWTYSCINCQRSLPHLEAWSTAYAKAGLTVVGVHTPEFAFEHVVGNISRAATKLGVHYPIAVDNDYGTWNNYQNSYWPAEYLIDASGTVRHVGFGEGHYAQTETFIRQLLRAARPMVALPPRTEVPDQTPQLPVTPESYLGYHYSEANLAAESVHPDRAASYTPPAVLPQDEFAFGGAWTVGSEEATAGAGATLSLRFRAQSVFLVLGGSGTVRVSVDGGPVRTVTVSGEPTLYRLLGPGPYQRATMNLALSPGVQAYDFTFG
jgi:cytochrome c biogenesis protein CcdA/thiol-disulfide isomerase/thioredoxin